MSDPRSSESADPADVTRLLREGARGDRQDALGRVMPMIYHELRQIARQRLRGERGGHTLPATILVREAYQRLVDQTRVEWRDRSHFFAVASEAMRRILVDSARQNQAASRHGSEPDALTDARALELIALDDALHRLATFNPEGMRVVQYRVFGGLSNEDIALVMGTSERTVRRTWTMARAWLHRELGETAADPGGLRRPTGATAGA